MVAADPDQLGDALRLQIQFERDLLDLGLPAELALEGAAGRADLVQLLHHVHRQPDHSGLLRDTARDRLANPPGRICREFEALAVVELFDRADQARVALLDQIQQRHLRPAVATGDRDHQPQVRGHEALLCALALFGQPLELFLGCIFGRSALLPTNPPLGQQLLREQTCLDRLSELDLFFCRKQGRTSDLFQVETDAVLAVDTVIR